MRVWLSVLALLAVIASWLLWTRHHDASRPAGGVGQAGVDGVGTAWGQAVPPVGGTARQPFSEADFPIAAALNQPGSTIMRDLAVLHELFEAWRTNFPQEGNPVGENSDITAALVGSNPLHLALVPKGHPAINAAGELCDRWGTPFRFHQLSGQHMEIRSAGPDRRFATADDAVWNPAEN